MTHSLLQFLNIVELATRPEYKWNIWCWILSNQESIKSILELIPEFKLITDKDGEDLTASVSNEYVLALLFFVPFNSSTTGTII